MNITARDSYERTILNAAKYQIEDYRYQLEHVNRKVRLTNLRGLLFDVCFINNMPLSEKEGKKEAKKHLGETGKAVHIDSHKLSKIKFKDGFTLWCYPSHFEEVE